jgi:drug/metabolite transporter (DMT)-like permease
MEPADRAPHRDLRIGSLYGLTSAILFGASTPFSKLLLPGVGPLMLAALLYLGAAILIAIFRLSSLLWRQRSAEAKLRRADIPVLCAIVGVGGVLAPVLMLFGLVRISALAGSLLLNLEAVFTILFAVLLFREHLGLDGAVASCLVVLGAIMLSHQSGPVRGDLLGTFEIVGACLCWALDNNLSQGLSVRDPVAVVLVKTAGAGSTALILSLLIGNAFPAPAYLIGSVLLGSLSYGVSLLCVMLAFRYLGAARQAAWFSTAPFVGAALSIPIFGALPTSTELLGATLMLAGILLLVREHHAHVHTHEVLEHDHLHFHDQHHAHEHAEPVLEAHSHLHRHDPITHEHPHVSDIHHRHRHA